MNFIFCFFIFYAFPKALNNIQKCCLLYYNILPFLDIVSNDYL